MRRAACLLALAVLATSGHAWAGPAAVYQRRLAEAPTDTRRVVVSEGDAKTARLVGELEQELKASSYVVVRVAKVPLEPDAMLRTLREARAARGILLADDGKSVLVLAASPDGKRLRVYGEHSVDRDNRLARRRQWISLVERLRVPTEDEDETGGEPAWNEGVSGASPAAAVTADASPRGDLDEADTWRRDPNRLGATVALGYVTGRTGLTSHLLLMGNRRLSPRISVVAHALWPMVPGERATSDGLRSRVWTFAGNLGLMADLGRPSWWANPYLGMTAGMQFLLAYVDWAQDASSGTYRIASLAFDLHAGVRFSLRRAAWLVWQISGGHLTSLATESGPMTENLAEAWALRSAFGLLMAF